MDGFCCSKSVLNKLLLTDDVIRNVEIHFHVPGAIILHCKFMKRIKDVSIL
jgi:hypothetical protein